MVTVFRYGVVVLFGMSILEEDQVVRGLHDRTVRPVKVREDRDPTLEVVADKDEQILPGRPILLKAITPERMVVIADALAKSAVLARDEREVSEYELEERADAAVPQARSHFRKRQKY